MILAIPPRIIHRVQSLDLSLREDISNREIGALLSRTLLLGGKRFRPLLTYAMGDFFELPLEDVEVFARTIEFTHSATLAHDDVIDRAHKRRGAPTLNALASNKKAILSGDYLLAEAMLELSREGDIRLVQELSGVLQDLVDGEWLQMQNTLDQDLYRDQIERVARKKTASTITWCCLAPAIKANASKEVLSLVRSFGTQLGLAFQEIDDAIDFAGDSQDKGRFQDMQNGIMNVVAYTLVENDPLLREKMLGHDWARTDMAPPWSEAQLEKALAQVRQRAHIRLDGCRANLERILELEGRSEGKRARSSLCAMEAIIGFLADRTK
ncbi:MAG: polyprenyl synthetase family protein [Bacteriovoracales bacterium]|nr:polyprenyl synthetase family protein [Bacteriovoracales bacterium]